MSTVNYVTQCPSGCNAVRLRSCLYYSACAQEVEPGERTVTMVHDLILRESLALLRYHFHPEWGDRTPFDVFTRLLAKRIMRPGWTPTHHEPVRPSQIVSERQTRPTKQLAELLRTHTRHQPWNEAAPIIIAFYRDEELLIDGTTRINKWERESNDDNHPVNLHIIR